MPTKCALCPTVLNDGDIRHVVPDGKVMGRKMVICPECYERMKNDDPLKGLKTPAPSPEIKLTPQETRVIQELRNLDWGKLTVLKKGGAVVMITPAPDILVGK